MIDPQHQLPDPLSDNAGIVIKELRDRKSWGPDQEGLLTLLIDMLGRKRYITFSGRLGHYHLERIGQSCLLDVPPNRRGRLSVFRGQRIRLVCVGADRMDHRLMAGPVGLLGQTTEATG